MKAALQLAQSLHKQLSAGARGPSSTRLKLAQSGADAVSAFYRDASKIHGLHTVLGEESERVPSHEREELFGTQLPLLLWLR